MTPHDTLLAGERRELGIWQSRRETLGGRDWLRLALTASDGVCGEAWAPHSDAAHVALERVLDAVSRNGHKPAAAASDPTASYEHRLAHGLVASAQIDVLTQRHAVPLHVWMGGALRPAIRVTLPIVLRERSDRARRAAEIARASMHVREAATALGVTSFALHDASHDIDRLADAVVATREAVGAGAAIVLRLAGQLTPDQTRALADRIRDCDVIGLVDPCATLATSLDATRDRLPALGLSASRYDRDDLLSCLAATPPALLLIDPLIEGGPLAVRALGAIARVLHIDVALTAESGGAWLVHQCTELAAVVPASHQPIELPAGWTTESLHALGVHAGMLRPADALAGAAAAATNAVVEQVGIDGGAAS